MPCIKKASYENNNPDASVGVVVLIRSLHAANWT